MTRFETSVRIRRPIGDVFDFVADPLNFRHWNPAVRAVWSTHRREGMVGSTYRMERDPPSGRVRNHIKIFAHEYPAKFGIRTTSGPTPFSYRYSFSSDHGETVVQLDGAFELSGVATLLGPLAGRAVKHGAEDNLNELKNILETTPRPAQHRHSGPPSPPLALKTRKFRACLHGKGGVKSQAGETPAGRPWQRRRRARSQRCFCLNPAVRSTTTARLRFVSSGSRTRVGLAGTVA